MSISSWVKIGYSGTEKFACVKASLEMLNSRIKSKGVGGGWFTSSSARHWLLALLFQATKSSWSAKSVNLPGVSYSGL